MLKLTLKPGEYLLIGDEIKVVYAGGSSNNGRFLVDAPKSMNVARSRALEKQGKLADPGNEVRHYKDRGISKEAQEKIRLILREERKREKAEREKASGTVRDMEGSFL